MLFINAESTSETPMLSSAGRLAPLIAGLLLVAAACGSADSEGDRFVSTGQGGGGPGLGGAAGDGGSGGQVATGGSGIGGGAGAPGSGGQGTGGAVGQGGAAGMPGTGGTSGTGGGSTGGGGTGGSACYEEVYHAGANLADLRSSYAPQQWLGTMLSVLERRHPNGFSLLNQMKTDPWLSQDFPTYFDLGTWEGMISAVDTACHEETHGWDYEHALGTPGKHAFYLRGDLTITAPKLAFFPRSEILGDVQQGGSVTSMYDDYLVGEEGSYDFVALADEINAYVNGLGCATTVGDQFDDSVMASYRDGVAAHMLFLLSYIKHARTSYPSLYAQWRADADWQKFVRYSWARARFWTKESQVFPKLGIDDAAIWARVNQPANLAELEQFTGQSPDAVACVP